MIYLSSGHAKNDPGAISQGTTEYDEVQRLIQEIKPMLDFHIPISLIDDTLIGTIKWLTKTMKEGDIAIELHLDSATPTANGASIWYDDAQPWNRGFGEILLNNYCTLMDIKNRGAFPDNQNRHKRLGFTETGKSYVMEMGFITNKNDLKKIKEKGAEMFSKALLMSLWANVPDWAFGAVKWYSENKLVNKPEELTYSELKMLVVNHRTFRHLGLISS